MFRRSRFSVRPNVGPGGRTATATPQETPAASQEPSRTPTEASESSSATDVTNKSDVISSETGEGNEQNGEGTNSSAALQRRKRFSIKPKVAPGRPPALSRTPKSPVKAVSASPVEVSSTELSKPSTSSQAGTSAVPHGLQSPRRRRHSEDSKQHKVQPKLTPMSSEHSEPSPVDSTEQTLMSADSNKQAENISGSQVKDIPARPPDKVPPSLPDKEASEISEKAKTLVSSKNVLSLPPSALSLSRLLNSPSDLQRLVKAQKLRELLRQERCKEKRLKKAKIRSKEFTLDPTKMTMRDLIHYLPTSNPMMSSLEDSDHENETVVPPSPEREESPEQAQEPEVQPTKASSGEEEVNEEEVVAAEEEDEEALMVPRVKVAEDGSLIIDEESLTVEVLRAKGPNPADERDPIFERGSTTTYSSFRKGTYAKPWSIEETDMFFLAVSMVGTDFSMICQLFPHRARSEIKNKFKKEERINSWRIDKAFREKRKLDIEYFSKLLEKVLEVQKDRKKLKSLSKENTPKKRKTKAKGKKSERKLSDVEEEDENQVPDLEEGAQKENENQCNEGGSPAAEPKTKRKRKKKADALTEEPSGKKNKMDLKSNEQSEAGIPEDSEATLPEDHTNSDMTEKTPNVNTAKDTAVKPAKLSRGRAQKPLLPLGLKRGKKPAPLTKSNETVSEKGEECESGGASKAQANKDESPLSQDSQGKSPCDDISSEEEDVTVKPQKPTRYGRVPKPIQPLNYPAKEDQPLSASETTPASPSASKSKPKCTAKRGKSSKPQSAQKSKKPKLVTLRSSKSDFSDDEDENQWEDGDVQMDMPFACSSSKDSNASVFLPASLYAANPEISEVDETMVELDILDSMPDVLGISHDAVCPDSSCQKAQHETGTAEPCEHQLDLLVDVIDFLSTEHTEVSEDESYNEAAQTLLTIGNVAHVSQSGSETAIQDCATGTTSAGVKESSHLMEEILSAELKQNATSVHAAFGQEATENTETVASLDLQSNVTDSSDKPHITASELKTTCDLEPTPQLQSNPDKSNENPPLTMTGRFSKVKPKPNFSRTSRTAQPVAQTEISKERKAEESHTVAPSLSQVGEPPSASQEMNPKMSDSAQASLKHDISITEVKLMEESSDRKDRLDDQVESNAATSDQNSSVIQRSWLSEFHSEPSKDQDTRDAESTSVVTPAETGSDEPSTSDSALPEVVHESFAGSAPVQEDSDKRPTSPAEDLPIGQKEGSKTEMTYQSKRSRLPKVKPKPNLPQSSKTTRSKPQTTEETVEKELHSTPHTQFQKTAEIESQPTGTPSLTFQPTEDLTASADIKTCAAPVDQAVLDVAKQDLTVTEIQNLSKVQLEPVRETSTDTGSVASLTEENLTSHAGTTEGSNNDVVLTDLELSEPQVGQGLNVDSALGQEGSGSPATVLTSVEELTVSQEDCKAVSTPQSKRSLTQRIKPKPSLPQTSRAARFKPQTAKEPAEKHSSQNPQQASIPSSEKQSEDTDPASVTELLTSYSTLKSTDGLSVDEEKKTDTGLIEQRDVEATTSDQSATEKLKLSEVQLELSRKQTTKNEGPVSDFIDKNLMSSTETSESSCNKMVTADSGIVASQVGQTSHVESSPVQEQSGSAVVLPVSKPDVKAASACQLSKGRLQKLKPKPNLLQTSRAGRSKPQAAKEPVEKESSPKPELHKKTTADVEPQQPCASSPEKQSESSDPAPVLKTLNTTGYMVGLVGQVDIDAPTSDQTVPEILTFPEVQHEPMIQQNTIDTGSTSEIIAESPASHDEMTESSSDQTESQAGQESDVDSAAVKGSSNPATSTTPVEHLQVSRDDGIAVSACLLRRSRLQKPKPNLPRTTRAARSKPQTAKEPAEKDSSQNPQQASIPSSEKQSEDTDPASVTELLTSDSTLKSTDGLSVDEDKKTDTGLIEQRDVEATTSDQSATEKLKLSEVQLELSREQTTKIEGPVSDFIDKNLMSSTETSESSCNKMVTADSGIVASQVGQTSNVESSPVQEQSGSAVVLPVGKPDVEAASACQLRKGRLQKLKPKPNLPQTSRAGRSKPQAAKEPVEKESSPKPELHKKTTADVEPQQPCASSPEKQSESSDPAPVLKTLNTTGYMVGLVGQVDIDAPTSDQTVPEILTFPEVQLEPMIQQNTIDTGSTSEIIAESPASHDEITESSSDLTESQAGQESDVDLAAVKGGSSNPATSTTPVEHLQVSQDDGITVSACLLRRSRLQKPKPKPNLPRTSRAARSKPQMAKEPVERGSSSSPNFVSDKTIAEMKPHSPCSTFPEKQSEDTDAGLAGKVDLSVPMSDQGTSVKQNEEKANRETKKTCEFTEENLTPLVQTTESSLDNEMSNFAQSEPIVTKGPVSPVQLVDKLQSSTSRLESPAETATEEEAQPTCSTSLETSTTCCASDSAPSLELASTPTCTGELSSAEEKLKTNVGVGQVLTSDCAEKNVPQRRQRLPKLKPKPNLQSPRRFTLRKPKADDCSKPSEDHMDSSITSEEPGGSRSSTEVKKESAVDKVSKDQAAEMGPVSHEDFRMDVSCVASSNNQPITKLSAALDVQSLPQDSTKSKIDPLFILAASPTCSQRDSSVQSNSPYISSSSMGHSTSESTDSSKTSNKPQTTRGYLVKPKPNLRCSSHLQQAPLEQNTNSTGADSGSCSQVVDASVDEKHESDHRPDNQESAEGILDKPSVTDSSSNYSRVSAGCVTQLTSSQNALTSSIEGIQSYPLLSQILPEQVPSDPDEPFFILSLTEIPVASTGDVLNSTAEHLSYLPVTDASKQQPIVSGESSTAGDGSISNVPACTSTKGSDAMGVYNVKDVGPASSISEGESSNLSLQKDPVDPQGNTPVQPEIVDSKDNDISPPKQRLTDRGRKAKLPVKSNTRKKRQVTPASTETELITTQDTDHPESSVKTVSGDFETVTCGQEPDISLGLQTAQRVGRRQWNRKAVDFPTYVSETKGKAASRRAKVKTPSAAGKQSSEPVASESHDVAPTQSFTQTPIEAHSTSNTPPAQSLKVCQTSDHRPVCSDPTPSTSYSTEVSASQEGDSAESSSLEEEPITVSQYFLSDIFTDVEEG